MTLQAFCKNTQTHGLAKPCIKAARGRGGEGGCAHELSRFCTLLYVHDELLLALLELCALAIELALRFGERALVLAQPLCGRDGATKECFLGITSGQKLAFIPRKTYDDVHVELLERKRERKCCGQQCRFLRSRSGDGSEIIWTWLPSVPIARSLLAARSTSCRSDVAATYSSAKTTSFQTRTIVPWIRPRR